MNLNDVVFGRSYMDKRHGLVRAVAPHCDDGACIIVERWDAEGDESELLYSEACFLSPMED